MKRKILASLVAAVMLMSLALTGCSAPANNTSATPTEAAKEAPKTVTIEFMHSQPEEERVTAIQKNIDAFMAANPGIVVKQVPVPEDTYMTKLTTLISSQ